MFQAEIEEMFGGLTDGGKDLNKKCHRSLRYSLIAIQTISVTQDPVKT